jgi:hypothetical protein
MINLKKVDQTFAIKYNLSDLGEKCTPSLRSNDSLEVLCFLGEMVAKDNEDIKNDKEKWGGAPCPKDPSYSDYFKEK